MFVSVARLTFQIPESGSLKDKRQVLRRITDRVRARFNVSVAEVDGQDLWQKAVLGLSVVANERRHADEQMEKIIHFIEEMYVAPLVSRETEVVTFGDQLYASRPEGEQEEEGDEGLDAEELIARLNRAERSMAEAEGLSWEQRHEGRSPPDRRGAPRSLEEARARARSLRKPRDWEKP